MDTCKAESVIPGVSQRLYEIREVLGPQLSFDAARLGIKYGDTKARHEAAYRYHSREAGDDSRLAKVRAALNVPLQAGGSIEKGTKMGEHVLVGGKALS